MWSWQPKKWPKRSKNRGKWPYYGYFWAIGIALWRRDSYNINIYWHPWFGPILSTFGCLEVSFPDNSSLVWLGVSEVPAPFAIGTLSQIRGGEILDFSSKSPLGKTAATLDPEIKKRLPMWQFEAISQEKKPLGKMESVRNCSRGVKEVWK